MVAAACVAVEAVDEARVDGREPLPHAVADEARPVPRGRLGVRLLVRREDADGLVVGGAVAAGDAADDVIGDVALDVEFLLHGPVGETLRAEESLLLAHHGGEDDRRAGRRLRQHARQFHDHGRAGSVVVRTGGVTRCVHHVADDRIVVSCGDVDAVRIARAADRGHDIDHLGGLVVRPLRLLHRRLVLDGHVPAALGGPARHLVEDPLARRADPARRRGRVGERVARTERGELLDVRLQVGRIEPRQDVVEGRLRGEDGGRDGEGKQEEEGASHLEKILSCAKTQDLGCRETLSCAKTQDLGWIHASFTDVHCPWHHPARVHRRSCVFAQDWGPRPLLPLDRQPRSAVDEDARGLGRAAAALLGRELGVDLRGEDRGVAEDLLHFADVGAGGDE